MTSINHTQNEKTKVLCAWTWVLSKTHPLTYQARFRSQPRGLVKSRKESQTSSSVREVRRQRGGRLVIDAPLPPLPPSTTNCHSLPSPSHPSCKPQVLQPLPQTEHLRVQISKDGFKRGEFPYRKHQRTVFRNYTTPVRVSIKLLWEIMSLCFRGTYSW